MWVYLLGFPSSTSTIIWSVILQLISPANVVSFALYHLFHSSRFSYISDAKIFGVQIGHNTTEDEMGRAETFRSKYKFQQECKKDELPPFPSSLTYDSKAWTFIKENASKGALFWNVGK